jgi:hypothetical protein
MQPRKVREHPLQISGGEDAPSEGFG